MFKEILEANSYIYNKNGGLYYSSSYDANLDLFIFASRDKSNESLIHLFSKALNENKLLATAILLFNLDIRFGKGERRIFKILFKYLCLNDKELALKVLYLIPKLGRYDYILETIDTPLWNDTIKLIKLQLDLDLCSNNPSLLAKWLPSARTHNKNNKLAIKIAKELNISIKEYRKKLSYLRSKLEIVEHKITNQTYNTIDYEKVPSIAMKKYHNLFNYYDNNRFNQYLKDVSLNNKKINTSVLEPYQIIKEVMKNGSSEVLDLLWKNQVDILDGNMTNALVIADTSGSMFTDDLLPISTALGLAIYISERNKGIFHNTFLNFSDNPTFQTLKGDTLSQKLKSIDYDNFEMSTNIDRAIEIILEASIKSKDSECPSHLIIISDMEFNQSIDNKPNYLHWKSEYEKHNLKMPKVIFWCVSKNPVGIPIVKNSDDTIIISGFTPKIFKGILDIDNYNPIDSMIEILDKYINLLK